MDIEEIRKYLDLMNEYDLEEMEVEAGEAYFRFCRSKADKTPPAPQVLMPQMVAGTTTPSIPAAGGQESPQNAEAAEAGLLEIRAPMVGTFYRAPAPDASPFVEVGDHVTPETVVAIIEAMKVMNEIKAEVSGTIRKILVEDAKPVEYGQVLFLVDPD